MNVETFTPRCAMTPIGPYSHIAKAGPFLWISGTAGVDPKTGELAGPDTYAQARQILRTVRALLESVGSSWSQVVHIQIFLKRMDDYEELNRAYREELGTARPARTVVSVSDLPRHGALLTMSVNAVAAETSTGNPR